MKRRTLFNLIPILGVNKVVPIQEEVKPVKVEKQYTHEEYFIPRLTLKGTASSGVYILSSESYKESL